MAIFKSKQMLIFVFLNGCFMLVDFIGHESKFCLARTKPIERENEIIINFKNINYIFKQIDCPFYLRAFDLDKFFMVYGSCKSTKIYIKNDNYYILFHIAMDCACSKLIFFLQLLFILICTLALLNQKFK